MQGCQASFSYLNSFLQQRCHYLWSHFFQSEVPAGLWMIMGISVCAAGNRFARDVCTILSLFMTIWMFCCSQKHSYTLTRSGHVEISLDLKRKKRQKRKKQDRKKKAYTQPPLFPTDSTLTQLGSLREYTLSDQNNETTGLWRKVFSVNVEWTLEMEGFHLAQLWFI